MHAPQHPAATPSAPFSYWACQLLGWGVYGLSQVYNVLLTLHVPLGRAALEIAVLNVAAICLTHGLRSFMRRRSWRTLRMPALLPRVLAATVVLGMVQAAIMQLMTVAPMWALDAIDDAAVLASLPDILLLPPVLRTFNWSVAFLVWIAMYLGITSLRDRHAAELRQSELTRALQAGRTAPAQVAAQPAFPVQFPQQRARAHRRGSSLRSECRHPTGAHAAVHADLWPGGAGDARA